MCVCVHACTCIVHLDNAHTHVQCHVLFVRLGSHCREGHLLIVQHGREGNLLIVQHGREGNLLIVHSLPGLCCVNSWV